MLAVLQGKLGYEIERQRGSHRRLVAKGRPPLTFAFHDSVSLHRVRSETSWSSR